MQRALGFLTVFFFLLVPTLASAQSNPPVADAGPDQDVFVGAASLLQGSALDPDGDFIADWLWTIESAPAGSSPFLSDATVPNPFIIPDVAGDYVLSLIAYAVGQWSEPDTVIIHAADLLPPVAAASADITSGRIPFTVNFDGSLSVDNIGDGLTYSWTFGDGSATSNDVSPSHEYIVAGTYTARLSVVDSYGQSDASTIVVDALPPTNNPPVASPTATPNTGTTPLTVQFAANADDADEDPLTYAWDFGETNTSSDADPMHTYTSSGTYTVWLTVSDGLDDTTASLTIVVDPALAMTVDSARVRPRGGQSSLGSVDVALHLDPLVPATSDVVSVVFDGIVLFAEPFSAFVSIGRDNENDAGDGDPTLFKLKQKDLRVLYDVIEGELTVDRKKLDLSSLDNANGVDVELQIGSAVAVENITMQPHGANQLYYDAAAP